MEDVEDALTDLDALADEVETLRGAVDASRITSGIARAQFKYGLVD